MTLAKASFAFARITAHNLACLAKDSPRKDYNVTANN